MEFFNSIIKKQIIVMLLIAFSNCNSYASNNVIIEPGLWLIGYGLYTQSGVNLLPISSKQFCYTSEDINLIETIPHPELSKGGDAIYDGCTIRDIVWSGNKTIWSQKCERTVNFPNEEREFSLTTFISLDNGEGVCVYKPDSFSCFVKYTSYNEPGASGAPHKDIFVGQRLGHCR